MKIDRPKRARKSNKRMDLTDMRELFRDRRQWSALGVVVGNPDSSPYWRVEMSDDGNSAIDVLVDIVLQPGQERVTARLMAGMFVVPAVGEECIVVIPAGRVDFMPTIVGILSSNNVPNQSTDQAPSPTRIVLVRPEVLVHDGAGGAAPLALLSDVQSLRDWLSAFVAWCEEQLAAAGHTHTLAGTAVTDAVVPTAAPPTDPIPEPSGTTVLKAK